MECEKVTIEDVKNELYELQNNSRNNIMYCLFGVILFIFFGSILEIQSSDQTLTYLIYFCCSALIFWVGSEFATLNLLKYVR